MKPTLLIPLIGALIAVLAYTQGTDVFELRGVVLEIGPNAPLAGAQVTVYQFDQERVRRVFASSVTDSGGAFQFKPTLPGDYYVEVSKPDYFSTSEPPRPGAPRQSSTGGLANLSKDHPSAEFRFALLRFGELKGKVVDEDGKPLSKLQVDLIPATPMVVPALSPPALRAIRGLLTTAADGSFDATGLVPGGYVVRVSTWSGAMKHSETEFSPADEDAVDQDFATSYWPGVAERASAGMATVNPGDVMDIGTLHIHKEPRYRIHFVVHGCEPGDQMNLQWPGGDDIKQELSLLDFATVLPGLSETGLPCKDLLLGGLRAGSYRFIATTQHGAVAMPFTITDRNATVPLTLIANGDVVGRVVTASGDPPPPGQPGLLGRTGGRILPDAKGNFTISGVQCLPASLRLLRLDAPYYIKELRVNGVAVSGEEVTLCAGSRLEIVLDDKVGTLAVSLNAGDKPAGEPMIFVQKWPMSLMELAPPSPGQPGTVRFTKSASPMESAPPSPGQSGAVQFTKLAPGDYRVLAVRPVVLADGEDVRGLIPQLWDRAAKITLGPGDAKSISVDVIDPFQ